MGKNRTERQAHLLTRAAANIETQRAGPARKTWTAHDMQSIHGRNARQRAALDARARGQNVALLGTAGTGKTFLGLAMAFMDLFDATLGVDHIIIVRSAVQGRQQGFLPGTIDEKMQPFSEPYRDALDELFPRFGNNYDNMVEAGKIVFKSTSFLRGCTFSRAVVLADEIQNYDIEEVRSIMTRGSPRTYLTGDTKQIDLDLRHETSGLHHLRRCLAHMPSVTAIEFTAQDIVRKGLAREFILAEEQVASAALLTNPIPQPAAVRAA